MSKRRQPPKSAKKAAKKAPARKAAASPQQPRPPKPSREERWEEARRAKRRRALLVRAGVVAALVVVVGGIVFWQVGNRRDEAKAIDQMTAGTCEFDRKTDPGAVNQHAESVSYKVEPPSGGIHLPSAANPGVYTNDAPPDGQIVHAMEHGDIVFWYRPDAAQADIDALTKLAESRPSDVFVIERPRLPVPFAATAWRKRLLCDRVEAEPLRTFVSRWADKGPEKVKD